MAWWLWILLGLALIGGELVGVGGFYLVFPGAGALLVGALVLLGGGGTAGTQWLVFSLASVFSALFFRKPLLEYFKRKLPARRDDELVGETAIAAESIAAGDVGRAELRGTTWSARNVGAVAIAAGQRCVVERVDGLVIGLRPA
jgi:membrane protein implicated in regulation of membrane protease activity